MTEETRALLTRSAKGDKDAEASLIEQNNGLIWAIAKRYCGRGTEPDDLYQLGCMGFIKAVRGFDPEMGYEFSTYAVPKIAGEIRRFLRDNGAVKVSRAIKERAAKVRKIQSELEIKLGRSPTVSELAEASGLTNEEVAACEQAEVTVDSIDRELSGGGLLSDILGDGGIEDKTCMYISLQDAIKSLPEKEKQVIVLRFSKDMTQQQAAKVLGVSQVQISRIEKRALKYLRDLLEN